MCVYTHTQTLTNSLSHTHTQHTQSPLHLCRGVLGLDRCSGGKQSFRCDEGVSPFPVSDISYTLTLDADLQATRVASRGLFLINNERSLTEDAMVSSTLLCKDYQVYVQVSRKRLADSLQAESSFSRVRLPQEAPDFVNSLSLKVEIEQKKANVNPVLDRFSPSAWEFFVSDTSPSRSGSAGRQGADHPRLPTALQFF